MDNLARILILSGGAILFVGVVLLVAARLGVGRLPGDILIEHGNVRIFFPIVTMILLSILLTIVLNVAIRIFR